MWFALWCLLSLFVLGMFAWSLRILLQQKRAWKAFATRNGLSYEPGKLMMSPAVFGAMNGFRVSFFTDAQQTGDARGQRFVTVIEIALGPGLPVSAAIATKEYAAFLSALKLDLTYVPAEGEWDKEYIVKTNDPAALAAYLTAERQKALHGLFTMKSSMALFFFDPMEAVLRIETPDPLRDADRMDKIARRILAVAATLVHKTG